MRNNFRRMSSEPPQTPHKAFFPPSRAAASKDPTQSPESVSLFHRRLNHLRAPLHPLVSLTTGLPHSDFPKTILHYHLLTSPQLDALAHHYHQRTPCEWSLRYPCPVVDRWKLEEGTEKAIGGKRRRFGRFVGFGGCDSPDGLEDGEIEEDEEHKLREKEMRRWVDQKIRWMEQRDRETEIWRGKGF